LFKGNRSRSTGQRTAQEREQARREREQRRAGDAFAAAAPPPEQAPPLESLPQSEGPPPSEQAHPSEGRPQSEPPHQFEQTPPPEQAPPPERKSAPEPVVQTAAAAPPTEELAPAAEAPPEDPVEEPPVALSDLPPEDRVVEPPVASPDPRPRGKRTLKPAPARRGRRTLTRLGALVALLAAIAVVWLLVQSLDSSGQRSAPAPPKVAKIVIPEGYTRRQIALIATAAGLRGDYLAQSRRSSLVHPTRYGAPAGTPSLEGFLFPASYELYAGAPVKRLVDEQLAALREHFGTAEIDRARALHVTPYGLLTVASMIEREAEVERDRPLIAAVIYNRLRAGMTLGIDATLRYALNDYSAPLTEAQLRTPSAYNTRLHTGLPPTPIANPGAASIQAAAHPAHVSYLYYVAAADGCGEHVFSTSYAQFEHDAAAYREALAKNHGRVPSCRHR
jgi:cell division protein YceG involved in septum cleavage